LDENEVAELAFMKTTGSIVRAFPTRRILRIIKSDADNLHEIPCCLAAAAQNLRLSSLKANCNEFVDRSACQVLALEQSL
jgi:hypothetical protein